MNIQINDLPVVEVEVTEIELNKVVGGKALWGT